MMLTAVNKKRKQI